MLDCGKQVKFQSYKARPLTPISIQVSTSAPY